MYNLIKKPTVTTTLSVLLLIMTPNLSKLTANYNHNFVIALRIKLSQWLVSLRHDLRTVCKKVEKRFGILGHVKRFMTKEAVPLVYNTIILALFDYCNISWSSLLQDIHTHCTLSSKALGYLPWWSLSTRYSKLLLIIFYYIFKHSCLYCKTEYKAIFTKDQT